MMFNRLNLCLVISGNSVKFFRGRSRGVGLVGLAGLARKVL